MAVVPIYVQNVIGIQ